MPMHPNGNTCLFFTLRSSRMTLLALSLLALALSACGRGRGNPCGGVGEACCPVFTEGEEVTQENGCFAPEGSQVLLECYQETCCIASASATVTGNEVGCATDSDCCGQATCRGDNTCCVSEGGSTDGVGTCCPGLVLRDGVCQDASNIPDGNPGCGMKPGDLCCDDETCPGEGLVCKATTFGDDASTDGSASPGQSTVRLICQLDGAVTGERTIPNPGLPDDPTAPAPIITRDCGGNVDADSCLASHGCGYCMNAQSGAGACLNGTYFGAADGSCYRGQGTGRVWLWSPFEYGRFSEDECAQYSGSCGQCVNAGAQCGYCNGKCVAGTESGPISPQEDCSVSVMSPALDSYHFFLQECS